jgi:DNA-binding PadR family transcriptional regulator
MKISLASQQKKKRDLERDVLTHLKECGASLYDTLSIRFDLAHTGEIQPVLHALNEYGYIEVNHDKMVTITTFGLEDLEGKD